MINYREGLVSVITPIYNNEDFLSETIESVLQQTYKEWELILIDDGSDDNSLLIAQKYESDDTRVHVLQMSKNSGMAESINYGCTKATGQYIAFLDSDDVWLPSKLEEQLQFMKKKDCAISCTSYIQINADGTKELRLFKAKEKVDYKRMLLDCPVGHSTVMYDVSKIGIQVIPNIRKRSDDALWLQILKVESYIWGLNRLLVKHRLRGKSLSSSKLTLVRYHWKLYREIEHMNVCSSLFHIAYWGFIKIVGIK